MKVLSKIEKVTLTIGMGFVLWFTSAVGAWCVLYDMLDMYSDEASVLYVPYLVCLTYWIIKKIVLRNISIIKAK